MATIGEELFGRILPLPLDRTNRELLLCFLILIAVIFYSAAVILLLRARRLLLLMSRLLLVSRYCRWNYPAVVLLFPSAGWFIK